jgi:site-specific recombinase XerD
MPVIIRTLYATGIRIGEAVRLKHRDVDLDAGYFTLHACKNGRDRVVPFSLSLREVCRDYVVYKQSMMMGTKAEDYFFMSPDGSPCLAPTVYNLFRIVLSRAGIAHGGKGKGPRLHDLRHTYCLNALVKMSEAGHDLYYSMPILMTCMGHQSIEATNRYVRLTAEMYPDLLHKVNEAYKYVFPEIGMDIENASNPEKPTP